MLRPDELAAYNSAVEQTNKQPSNTLGFLISQWRGNTPETASIEWKRLAKSTKETWGLQLNLIEKKWGETPLSIWNDPRMVAKVIDWRDSRSASPRSADIGVTVLTRLLKFGRLRAKVLTNVAAGVPAIYEAAVRAEIIWLPEDFEAFKISAIALNRPHVVDALELGGLTGMRREDLVGVTFGEVFDSAIIREVANKSRGRRRRAVVPLLPETKLLLEDLRTRPRNPGVRNLLVTSNGTPWTKASLTQAVHEVRENANGGRGIFHPRNPAWDLPDRAKHLHDTRGTFITRLCRAGLTDIEIANIVTWSPENVARVRRIYVDDAAVVVALSERISRLCKTPCKTRSSYRS